MNMFLLIWKYKAESGYGQKLIMQASEFYQAG